MFMQWNLSKAVTLGQVSVAALERLLQYANIGVLLVAEIRLQT